MVHRPAGIFLIIVFKINHFQSLSNLGRYLRAQLAARCDHPFPDILMKPDELGAVCFFPPAACFCPAGIPSDPIQHSVIIYCERVHILHEPAVRSCYIIGEPSYIYIIFPSEAVYTADYYISRKLNHFILDQMSKLPELEDIIRIEEPKQIQGECASIYQGLPGMAGSGPVRSPSESMSWRYFI